MSPPKIELTGKDWLGIWIVFLIPFFFAAIVLEMSFIDISPIDCLILSYVCWIWIDRTIDSRKLKIGSYRSDIP